MNAATITRAEWEGFAEATLTRRDEARQAGQHIARALRVRKPNRRQGSIPAMLKRAAVPVALSFLGAFFLGALLIPHHAASVQPYAGLTPQQVSSVATDLAPDTTP